MSLFRKMQVAAIEDVIPGVVNTAVYAAAQARHLIRDDAALEPDIPLYQRNVKRNSLTPLEGLSGMQMATCRFSLEMTGHSSSSTPLWDIFMRGCGLQSKATFKITIGAITGGPFRHNEVITQTTSGATAIVIHDTYTGTTTLYVHSVTGTPDNTNVWTGGSTGATATPSTIESAAGHSWWPINDATVSLAYSGADPSVNEVLTGGTSGAKGLIVSVDATAGTLVVRIYNALMYSNGEALTASTTGAIGNASSVAQLEIPALTIALYGDGVREVMAGARGTWSLDAKIGEPAIMNFEFKGLYGGKADTSNLGGVTIPNKVPPVFLSASTIFAQENSAAAYPPRFTSLGLALNNQVEYREDANQATGLIEATITDRKPSGSIDPEQDLEASWPLLQNFISGDIWRLRAQVGTAAGNKFLMTAPGAQYSAAPRQNRAGRIVRAINFDLTGGHAENATVVDDPGEDNEIVLSYLT